MCIPFFFIHNVFVYLIDCSVVQSHFCMYWQAKKIHMTCFIAISALFWCPGTEAEISPRSTCMPKIMLGAVVNCGEIKENEIKNSVFCVMHSHINIVSEIGHRQHSWCEKLSGSFTEEKIIEV